MGNNPPLERTAAAAYFTCGRASRVRRRGRSTALRYTSRGAPVTDRAGDREVLQNLRNYGSDLSKPHHTVHYLYFKSIDAAQAAGAELREAGYTNLRVHRAPTKSLWNKLFGPKEFSCIA